METLRIEHDGPRAVLRLDKPRGNAIDERLLDDLAAACRELARDDSRAILLASANPKVFCPGLDLVTLIEYDRPRLQAFMLKFAESLWALYALPKPVVAAVNGAAVAGGCILALGADYRVLKRGAPIGLNEVKVGVPLPWSVSVLLRATTTPAALTRIGLLGRNFTDDQALAVGLADEVVEADAFDAACRARLDEFADKDAAAIATTKGYLREPVLREMKAREAALVDEFLAGWYSVATQARIRQAVDALSRK